MRTILMTIIIALFLQSCDFLDVVPDDTTTLEDAFKNEDETEKFLYGCYSFLPGSVGGGFNDFRNSFGMMNSNEQIGAYHWGAQWFPFMSYNYGLDNSSSPTYDYWQGYYQGIHQCYIFLDNVDKVVPVNMNKDVFERHKTNWKGEARYLIAFYHQMLFQYYGPAVLVHSLNKDFHPRSSVDDCLSTISGWYDEAESLLLDKQPTATYGRATKTMAKSMKAKLLLYGASPLQW